MHPAFRLLLPLFALAAPAAAQPIVVNTVADSGPGSLRAAILQAEANRPVHDLIVFQIGGGGPQTITLLSALPPLTDPAGVTIDGFSQTGAGPGVSPPSTATVMIELDGRSAGAADGLLVLSDDNVIQGLAIGGFWQDGIRILGGGPNPNANPTANRNRIRANFLGTDHTGILPRGNGRAMSGFYAGVHVGNAPGGVANQNVVEGNLVADNWTEGIWFEGPRQPGDVGFNVATDNYVGTDVTGTLDLGNRHEGIALTEGTHDNRIADNLVSGNDFEGIGLQGFSNVGFGPPIQTTRNLIERNLVGLDANLNPLPNTMHGIAIGQYGLVRWGCADFNTIRDNVVAHNGGDGIAIVEDPVNTTNGDRNEMRRNAIWGNAGLGIDLGDDGVTGNDPGDPDNNANELLNFPVIQAVQYAVVTTVQGRVDIGAMPQAATVELFVARSDPSGHGEGYWYLGSTNPDGLGNWSFASNRPAPGDRITATVTDAANNTSEFARNAVVPGTPSLTATANTVSTRIGGSIGLTLNAGPANANALYVIAGSLSGTVPGTPLGSVVVPLNRDVFTSLVLASVNTPTFAGFLGTLDGSGSAAATLNMPALGPGWNGVLMHYAYVVAPFTFASNPIGAELVGW